jgi:uncharacterized repeat protein (TIGR03943 family)
MNPAALKRHYYIRSFILLGFTFFLADLLVSGKLNQYLAPRLHGLSYVTLAILLVLTGASLRQAIVGPTQYECDCAELHNVPRSWWRSLIVYGLFVLPLFMAFLMPDKLLGSAVAEKRGLNLLAGEGKRLEAAAKSAPSEQTDSAKLAAVAGKMDSAAQPGQSVPPQQADKPSANPPGQQAKAAGGKSEEQIRQLFADNQFGDFYTNMAVSMYKQPVIKLDEQIFMDGLTTLDLFPKQFSGHRLETVGFVYREPQLKENQFVAARFSVSCCTADAAVYGLLVEAEQANKWPTDSWVKVSGRLEARTVDGFDFLVLKAGTVEQVKAPKDPYVYYNYNLGSQAN